MDRRKFLAAIGLGILVRKLPLETHEPTLPLEENVILHKEFAVGFKISRELIEDDLYRFPLNTEHVCTDRCGDHHIREEE